MRIRTIASQTSRRQLALLFLLVASVLLASPTWAADVKSVLGKWEATIESPRGTNDVVMEFKGSDEELQGTWTGPRGTASLDDVAYAGGKLTFQRNLQIQGRDITIDYEATVEGDTMKVKMTTPRGEREFTAKRAE